MEKDTIDLDCLFLKAPQSILLRTLVAEYLLSKGYLLSDLKALPVQIANILITEAYRFADFRLVEMGAKDKFEWKMRLPRSLN